MKQFLFTLRSYTWRLSFFLSMGARMRGVPLTFKWMATEKDIQFFLGFNIFSVFRYNDNFAVSDSHINDSKRESKCQQRVLLDDPRALRVMWYTSLFHGRLQREERAAGEKSQLMPNVLGSRQLPPQSFSQKAFTTGLHLERSPLILRCACLMPSLQQHTNCIQADKAGFYFYASFVLCSSSVYLGVEQ